MGKHKKSKSQDSSSDSESDDKRKRRSPDREVRRKKKSDSRRARRRSRSMEKSNEEGSPEPVGRSSQKLVDEEPGDSRRDKPDVVEDESETSEGEIKQDSRDYSESEAKRKRRASDSDEEVERQKRKRASEDENKKERKDRDESRRHRGREDRRERHSDDEGDRKAERSHDSRSYDDDRRGRRRDDSQYVTKSYYQGDYLDERNERKEEERRRREYDRENRERRRKYDEDRDRRSKNRREDDNGDRRNRRDRDRDSKDRDVRDKGEKKEEEPAKPVAEAPKQPTLGAYIPPAKLRMMQNAIEDKSSASYQRLAWEALKKSINGLINKVNVSNISIIVRELFKENLIRGRGILCRAVIQAQSASPTYTNVFAALVAIINTKFPNIGELLLKRLIVQFRRGYKRNDKPACLSAVKFIAHLVNQQVAHEVLALELLTLLLEQPTSHSIEVSVAFLKEVGARLDEVSPRGAHAIFERLRHLLHEGKLEKRIQYMIEVMSQVRKDKYEKYPAVAEDLDLVEEEDQFTHLVTLDEEIDGQDILNVFKMDEEYVANEEKYATLRKEILDESEGDEDGSGDEEEDSGDEEGEEKEGEEGVTIVDKTETNLLALRRTIYLTIQSSLDYEECCHKLLKMNFPEGQENELCHMILDCCAQQRTYEKFFGLLAQRFCAINMKYVTPFEEIFKATYDTVHRLDTNKLRNVAKFFAHLLFTDAISWTVLEHVRLTEEDTTSSSRIFVKILCQELSEYMGLGPLNKRFNDKTLKPYFEGLFPRDNPKNARFSINFFTSIGLGGLTDELREFLRPKTRAEP